MPFAICIKLTSFTLTFKYHPPTPGTNKSGELEPDYNRDARSRKHQNSSLFLSEELHLFLQNERNLPRETKGRMRAYETLAAPYHKANTFDSGIPKYIACENSDMTGDHMMQQCLGSAGYILLAWRGECWLWGSIRFIQHHTHMQYFHMCS